MKAKYYTLGNDHELVLQDGSPHKPKEKESYDSFIKRISEEVLETLEVKVFDAKSIKQLATKQAEKQISGSKGVQLKLLKFLLESRGIELEEPETKKEVKTVRKRNTLPKTEKQLERERLISEFKQTKKYKAVHKNIGRTVQYENRSQRGKHIGTIRSIAMSRNLDRVYYVILNDKTLKRDCCAITNVNLNL